MSTQADLAHLLRRATFGPFPGQVDALAAGGTAAAVTSLLSTPPSPLPAPPDYDWPGLQPVEWWLRRARDPAAGLAEKMVWFWHGLFCTSQDKINNWEWMWNQHQLFRQHALGNFRTLLQAITTDVAMLFYLDGNGSDASDPNENYSRELMELFSLGIGNYTEVDVRMGAKALAGWDINWLNNTSYVDQYAKQNTPVGYLGTQVLTNTDVVNTVCNQAAMPAFVVNKLYMFFHGVAPTASTTASLSSTFTSNNLEIAPVVSAILHDPLFFDSTRRMNRPRSPFEWVTAAFSAMESTDYNWAQNVAENMGQTPFYPPNVAGWPTGMTWLSAAQAASRADVGHGAPALPAIQSASDPIAAALSQCSLYEVTTQTRQAMTNALAGLTDPSDRASMALGLVLTAPEFALS